MQNAFLKKADLKNILVEISLMVHKDKEKHHIHAFASFYLSVCRIYTKLY